MSDSRRSAGENTLMQKRTAMMKAVRDAVYALVEHHMPDATPHPLDEGHTIFGIDERSRDGAHGARIFTPEKGHEDMYPQFTHWCFNLHPDAVTQDHSLRSNEAHFDALRSDLNRLFTGSGSGETFPVVAEKDPDGKALRSSTLKKVSMSMSSTEAVGAINILIYGTPEELYQRMRTHLAENADLREMLPKVSRALSQ